MGFFVSSFLFALSPKNNFDDWTLLKTQNNVSVYYKTSICSTNNVVFIRIVNSNQMNAVVSWSLWGGDPVNEYAIIGNQEMIGICPDENNKSSTKDLVDFIPSGKTSADIVASITIK
jgi:hypothetical protein